MIFYLIIKSVVGLIKAILYLPIAIVRVLIGGY